VANVPPRAGLLETRLLTDIHNGLSDALTFGLELARTTGIQVSAFSVMVVTTACQNAADLALLRRLLQNNVVHPITASISRRAVRLLDAMPPPSSLTVDDAIIAATALIHKLPLYTLDPARFAVVPRLTTIRPY
jgi:predicted nucleic acid-binding protein